jgi:imidazolonepropionase-like amidohydrolase
MVNLVIRNGTLLDCTGRDPLPRTDVFVESGRIASIGSVPQSTTDCAVVDASGCTVMPGLTDAHAHLAVIGPAGDHGIDPWISHVLEVKTIIETALQEGFTTVRDAGGLEPAYRDAVDRGQIVGPRILPSGSVLSQTGGHGDLRKSHEAAHAGRSIPGLVARPEVLDGADSMRAAAREQLRRGATQIKVFASGGILSPTDPWDCVQFSREEIAAAVEVARNWGTYVLAHCHSLTAIQIALAAGVQSIEHGTFLDFETAAKMHDLRAFLVPTLYGVDRASSVDTDAVTPKQRQELLKAFSTMRIAIKVAQETGLQIGSGSDLVGPRQDSRGREILLKAAIIGNHQAILSATRVNAELFRLAHEIGTVEVGKQADLILVRGQPLVDINVMADPKRVLVVIKGGLVVKDSEARVHDRRVQSFV